MNKVVIAVIIIIAVAGAFLVPTKPSYTLDIFTKTQIVNGQPWIMSITYIETPSMSPLFSSPSIHPVSPQSVLYTGNADPVELVMVTASGESFSYRYTEDVQTINTGSGSLSSPITLETQVSNIPQGQYNVSIIFSYDNINTTASIPATVSTQDTQYANIIEDLQTATPTFVTSIPANPNPSTWYVVSTNGQWSGATGSIMWGNAYPMSVEVSLTPIWLLPPNTGASMPIYFYTSSELYSMPYSGNTLFSSGELGNEQYYPIGSFMASHPIYWPQFGVKPLEPVSGLKPFDSQYTGAFVPASASSSTTTTTQTMPTSVPFTMFVEDLNTGNPATGATVTVNGVGTFTVNSNGNVQFSVAPNVQYSVTVSQNGYQTWSGTIEYKLSASWSSSEVNNQIYLSPTGSSQGDQAFSLL